MLTGMLHDEPPTEVRREPAGKRVARGAAWLDRVRPGWHEHISVGRLDVDSEANCVIAQLYGGSFYRGLDVIMATRPSRISLHTHGFLAAAPRADAAALNHEWRTLILRRQYGPNPPGRIGRFFIRARRAIRPAA